MRKSQKLADEMVREFYETLLMLSVALLMHANSWHVLALLDPVNMPKAVLPASWCSGCFNSGLVLSLLQHRPLWTRRGGRGPRLLLFGVEMLCLLFLVDILELQIWNPFLGLVDMLLHALGTAKCFAFIYKVLPSLSSWLINDAFNLAHWLVSLTLLVSMLDAAAADWRDAIDYVVLGKLPTSAAILRAQRQYGQYGQDHAEDMHPQQHKGGSFTTCNAHGRRPTLVSFDLDNDLNANQ